MEIKKNNSYLGCMVREYAHRPKGYFIQRFVWECFNGLIPEGMVKDHINHQREDNRLCNLKVVTQKENCKKSAKNRDYAFVKIYHRNRKYVKAINLNTNEVTYYNSLYSGQQHLETNSGIIKMVCEPLNICKTGTSKKDGCKYKVKYIEKQNILNDCDIKKSSNLSKRLTNDQKKVNQKKVNQKKSPKKWR